MNHTEALKQALTALHDIGSALDTRRLLAQPSSNPIIRLELEKKAKKDDELLKLALDTWEAIVLKVEPKLVGTTVFECGAGEAKP